MSRTTIAEGQLRVLITEEIRKHPECSHVRDVKILRPAYLQRPNWEVAWVRDDNRSAPPKAWEVAFELQKKYDLA
jgi:hypothetical protein